MAQDPNRSVAAGEFRKMFPDVSPEAGTASQWLCLMRLAYQIQNEIVDVGKRHTTASRQWAKVGDEAKTRAGAWARRN